GHDGSYRHVEDLCCISVRKVPDVDQYDDVPKLRWDLGERIHDGVLGQALDHVVRLERLLTGRGSDLVRGVVIRLFEWLGLRRSLDLAAAIDVEVREDAKQPRTEIRARGERLPTPKRPRIGLLHEILCLLTRADESPRNPVDLVCERKRLVL